MDQQTPAPPAVPQRLRPNDDEVEDTAVYSLRRLQGLWSSAAKPSKPSYPPISSIPHTSLARLSEPDATPTTIDGDFPTEPILARCAHHAPSTSKTVLYLAYGSNLCAQTFLGMRGIRPISQVNVSAPSLDLTFDLPGLPYKEPCFANTAIRKIPMKPPPLPPNLPDVPDLPNPPPPGTGAAGGGRRAPVWNKGLYGVVYEVTQSDFAKIIATEGGGASYHDILVPCFPLPPSVSVPEKPAIPVPPRPFLARTLYAPRLPPSGKPPPPSKPDSDSDSDSSSYSSSSSSDEPPPSSPPHSKLPEWLRNLLLPLRRPSATYAQPSARYLSLILTGAHEHELPPDYIHYLSSLQPYTITSLRQQIGQVLFLGFWAPAFVLMMLGSRLLSDKNGKSPPWLSLVSTAVVNLVWRSYDLVAKPVFGDGERTEEIEDTVTVRVRRGSLWSRDGREEVMDEEKRGLLLT
ncbi:hypothetical protein QBC42DRAFT_283186 [Cladorrhinum samala]|uniref:gamma-glutamylcyclotransferase n=1 Tax=Cladorrhinum samala TaxID=585594 RepID=A0AAV9I2K1_9PEZI|nr:hypothetical protein QBC42DRAFT_283186 [Cladorrhinum samala]